MVSSRDGGLSAEERFAIQDLLTEFGLRVDHGRAATVAELFVENGVLATPMHTLEGRRQIEAHFARRDAPGTVLSRHQWSNLKLTMLEGDRVRAEMIVHTHLGTRGEAGPVRPDHVMVGDSLDVVERQSDGSWRFVERRLQISFKVEADRHAAPGSQPARG
jgi:hypothetical protein